MAAAGSFAAADARHRKQKTNVRGSWRLARVHRQQMLAPWVTRPALSLPKMLYKRFWSADFWRSAIDACNNMFFCIAVVDCVSRQLFS
jgi:hypothetical protein